MPPRTAIPSYDLEKGRAIAQDLAAWYATHARVLPWRVPPQAWDAGQRPDPYAVLVSEIALQQTTVAVGTTRVPELLARFPTLESMARATQEEVVDAWAGLGYYARARNLHAAARQAFDRHGAVPTDEENLRALPGVGPYTAAAVAAIAGGRRAVVVDGNVERVMARLFAIDTPLPQARPFIQAAADAATPAQGAGNHAQALMDLAASVCRPKAPGCPDCPVRRHCAAYALGKPETFPRRQPRRAKPHRVGMCAVMVDRAGGVWMERRPSPGLLAGTIGFPGGTWRMDGGVDKMFPAPGAWAQAGSVRHVFAHFSLDLEVWVGLVEGAGAGSNHLFAHPFSQMGDVRFSSLFAKAWEVARPSVVEIVEGKVGMSA